MAGTVTIQAGAHLPPLLCPRNRGSVLSFIELATTGPEQPVYGFNCRRRSMSIKRICEPWREIICARSARFNQPDPTTLPGILPAASLSSRWPASSAIRAKPSLLALLDWTQYGQSRVSSLPDWDSLKASFSRARASFQLRAFGMREVLARRIDYQRMKIKIWRRTDRAARDGLWPCRSGRVLALALRDYELRPYPGNITLFFAQDEPGANSEPANAWKGNILGGCETRLIPGTHRTILHRPQVISLAREISQRMPKTAEPVPEA